MDILIGYDFRAIAKKVINGALFYLGWWYCMREAVGNAPYRGSLLVLGIIIYNLAVSSTKILDLILIVALALTGLIVDTLYIQSGMITYAGGFENFPNIAPLWIISLWALYATSVNQSLEWLKCNVLLAAGMGAGGAISSYLVGIKLGSATLLWDNWWAFGTIGAVWAVVVPASIYLNAWLKGKISKLTSV